MRFQGKITGWKDDQGFGFVTPNGGGDKAFVHIKAFTSRARRPVEGDLITYELTIDENRRVRAGNVRYVGVPAPSATPSRRRFFGVVFAALFCCFLALVSAMGRLPFIVFGVYLAASVVAFFAYAMDKSAAQNNRWRTQKSTLHLFGLFGGWPGALIAQRTLRHKSKKEEFQTAFWATVFLNCGALVWLLTEGGSVFLGFLLSIVGIGS